MSDKAAAAFAPHLYLFQANAVALAVRLRRPEEVRESLGSASLTGIGGRAAAEGRDVKLHKGALTADSYRTEVTGDYADLTAAAKLTESHGDNVSPWRTNQLETVTTTECTINGFRSINFDSGARFGGPRLEAAHLDFKMEARHRRRYHDEMEVSFGRLVFSGVSVNGRALTVSARPDIFDSLPTFAAFKNEFNCSETFRETYGHMVYAPSNDALSWLKGNHLHDHRGFCTVTVVNQIEWADGKGDDARGHINGHSVIVPGDGTIYFGEMTVSPVQRRLHMVRVELGCPDGGSKMAASGCPGGHDHP